MNTIEMAIKELKERDKEIERLNNIINKFEIWLEEKSTIDYSCSDIKVHEQMALWWALRHLQELKGSDKE